MKKYFSTPEYSVRNKRKSRIALKKLREKNIAGERLQREKKKAEKEEAERSRGNNQKRSFKSKKGRTKKALVLKPPVEAPSDFRLIENTERCLEFFRDLRSDSFINTVKNQKFILMSLQSVSHIDYGTISVLTAISDDLKDKGIIIRGDFPDDSDARKFIEDSGFLDHMVDENNKKFAKAEKSDLIFFEKGQGKLSEADSRRISKMVKHVVTFLNGEAKHRLPIKTILLEICGNSIEWALTSNRQWVFGVKYETDKVIFTVTDVGKGILQTLHKKFGVKVTDLFTNKSDDEILIRAFDQKYGSQTQEVNRNKGLPSVKASFEKGTIKNLKVLTNNVILHFDNEALTKSFRKGSARFKGTIYLWEMNKECLSTIEKGGI